MSSRPTVPIFTKDSVINVACMSMACLLVLLGVYGYDSFNWSIRAKNWIYMQAGLDSTRHCSGRGHPKCDFGIIYRYQNQVYRQNVMVPQREYLEKLQALPFGKSPESITVPIKFNPEHPEEILVDPKMQLPFIGSVFLVGSFIVAALWMGARLLGRV